MIQAISGYIKNIAVFVIFMGFAGAVIPDGKYKGYINLTLSFILVILMLSPLASVLDRDFAGVFADLGLSRDRNVIAGEYAYNDEEQNSLILEAYKENLKSQLTRVAKSFAGYEFEGGGFVVGSGSEDFGTIYEIWLELSEARNEKKSNRLIWIEPVSVRKELPGTDSGAEDEEINNMKKVISDFYNITSGNIYITVRKTD